MVPLQLKDLLVQFVKRTIYPRFQVSISSRFDLSDVKPIPSFLPSPILLQYMDGVCVSIMDTVDIVSR